MALIYTKRPDPPKNGQSTDVSTLRSRIMPDPLTPHNGAPVRQPGLDAELGATALPCRPCQLPPMSSVSPLRLITPSHVATSTRRRSAHSPTRHQHTLATLRNSCAFETRLVRAVTCSRMCVTSSQHTTLQSQTITTRCKAVLLRLGHQLGSVRCTQCDHNFLRMSGVTLA